MLLNRDQIAALIPHGKTMCMLDEVVSWDGEQIHCRSNGFSIGNNSNNPLFENDQLDCVLLIEYAAQAAGVHAALLKSQQGESQSEARPAYIGAVKNIELLKPVSDNGTAIDLEAICLLNNSNGAIYEVTALQQDDVLMRGRLILNQP